MEGVRNRKCVAMHKDVGAIHESTENVGTGVLDGPRKSIT